MRVIMLVAGGIDAVGNVILAIRTFFGLLAGHVSLTLLSDDFIDVTLLGLEIVTDMV